MPEKFPSALVDPATGQVRRFRTALERLTGEILPDAGWHLAQGAKLFALGVIGGIPGILAGAGAAGVAYYRFRRTLARSHAVKRETPEGAQAHVLTQEYSRMLLDEELGPRHAGFADACLVMAKKAGLKDIPRVILFGMTNDEENPAPSMVLGSVADTDRKGTALLLGRGMADTLSADELRARVAEQYARIRLRHSRSQMMTGAQRLFNVATGAGLALMTFFVDREGPIRLLGGLDSAGVIAGIGMFGSVVAHTMTGIRTRATQALCDRGAVLITGDAGGLKNGLRAVAKALGGKSFLSPVRDDGPHKFGRGVAASGAVAQQFEKRLAAIDAFADQHPAFCAAQRDRLAAAFAEAASAPPRKPNTPANPAVSRRKLRR